LRSLFRKEQVSQELDEELNGFLEMAAEEKMKQGMSRKDALRAVRLEQGSLGVTKETVRSAGWEFLLETCWQDLRFAARMLRKAPGFSVLAVIILAVGIGANSAIFSVIQAVSLRPLPYKNPKRLVLLTDSQDPVSGAFLLKDIESFKSVSRSFADIAAYYRDSGFSRVILTSGEEPEFVQGAFVSANFFPLMGVAPAVGRVFSPEEDAQRERVVVLSYGLWMSRFDGALNAIGKMIQIDGLPSQIIGVMPATFQFPARDQQFWAPLTTNRYWDDPALTTNIDPQHTRYFYARWQAIGRLSPGATLAQAQTETNTVFRRSELDLDKTPIPGTTLAPLRVTLSGNTRLALLVLFCAVTLVLLISCSNVANLVLARGVAREREMAMLFWAPDVDA
jgi:predicted permease